MYMEEIGAVPPPGTESPTERTLRFSDLAEAGAAFRFCPACASSHLYSQRGRLWRCPDCGFEYFHNVATAAGIILECGGRIVFVVRAREPAKGKLALPGGFVEPGERAEDAAIRECREEIGWAPERIEFLASYPNIYRYHDIPYATCDMYFWSRAHSLDPEDYDCDEEESTCLSFIEVSQIPWDDIAFDSTRRALRRYVKTRSWEFPSRGPDSETDE